MYLNELNHFNLQSGFVIFIYSHTVNGCKIEKT